MQVLMIIGNLCSDPETKQVGDKSVCNFTVAVNRRKKADGTQEADFFRVGAWGALGENCRKYLAKGRKVAVEGTVSVHAYQKQDGTAGASLEVFAQNVEFLTPKGDGSAQTADAGPAQAASGMTDVSGAMEESLPF